MAAVLLSWTVGCLCSCERSSKRTELDYSSNRTITVNGDAEDGVLVVLPDKGSRAGVITVQGAKGQRYKAAAHTNVTFAYFRVAPSFKGSGLSNATVTVEYLDKSFGTVTLEYDSNDQEPPDRSEKGKLSLVVYSQGEYTPADERLELSNSSLWRTGRFSLFDVRFSNSQHGNADFRIKATARDLIVRSVTLERETP